jgi:hypothetical protein
MKLRPLSLINGRITEVRDNQSLTTNNFSYREIKESEFVQVVDNQQMIVSNSVKVDGQMFVDGEVYVCQFPEVEPFPELPEDNYSHFNVVSEKQIPQNQEMLLSSFVRVEDKMLVSGQMVILGSQKEAETSQNIPNKILENQIFKVAQNFEYYFRNFISIAGLLVVSGELVVGD